MDEFPPKGPTRAPIPALDQRLNAAQAAELLGVSPGTLKNWRSQQKGPAFYRLGQIFYAKSDLETFVARSRTDFHLK